MVRKISLAIIIVVDSIPGLGMPTTMTQFLLVVPAVLLILAGFALALPTSRRPVTASAQPVRPSPRS